LSASGGSASEARDELVGLRGREEADGAVVDREDGHAAGPVLAQPLQDRAVAPEDEAEVGVPPRLQRGDPLAGAPELAELVRLGDE
jgi:hypothetical protein